VRFRPVRDSLLPGAPNACLRWPLPRFVFSLLGPCRGRYGQRVFRVGIHRLGFEYVAQGGRLQAVGEGGEPLDGGAVFGRVRSQSVSRSRGTI
jgi:hypothetical protein